MTVFHSPKPALLLSSAAFTMAMSLAQPASAQAASVGAQGPGPQGPASNQEIVVTGVASSKGQLKQQAPFAIITATQAQIKDAAPTSTANLAKLVPGLWAETTGGQSGPNVEVRGFPVGGDAPYVTFQIDGLPIFPVSTLSFLDNSTQIRLDDTVARLEGTIGGPAVLWGAAQPGATMNLIQKNGKDNPEGSIRFTLGSGAEKRVDGYYGAKLGDDWYASLGGFYITEKGVRDTQYPSDQGYQIEGTVTHTIDDGRMQFYFRKTDTNTQFFTPLPLIATGSGTDTKIHPYPGFDPLTATFFSNANRFVTFDTAPGQTQSMDEARGRGVNTQLFGFDFDKSIGGFDFSNKMSYYSGTTYSFTQFTGALPQTLGSFITSEIALANKTVPLSATGGVAATSGVATNVGTGQAITDMNMNVIGVGNWYVKKELTAFQDEARLGKNLFGGNRLTVGFYVSHFTSNDVWYLGNQSLLPMQTNPTPISVTLNNGVKATSAGGIFSPVSTAVNNRYTGNKQAGVIDDEWHLTDKLKIDVGFRLEHDSIDATLGNTTTGLASSNALNLYDYGANMLNGTYTGFSHDWWGHAITADVGYEIKKNVNAFLSYNQGFLMPTFDDVRNNNGNLSKIKISHVKQVQGGVKINSDLFTLDLTGFFTRFTGQPQSQILIDGTTVNYLLSSRSEGLEFDVAARPFRHMGDVLGGFELDLTGDYMHGRYTSGGPGITGDQILKQPPVQFRLTPSYSLKTNYGTWKVYATTTYVANRWANLQNNQFLPHYLTEDVGASLVLNNGLELRVSGTNITNTLAITEGNSRVLGSGAVGGVFNGRPLFGATYEGSIAYHF